jgi:hypothetical protein
MILSLNQKLMLCALGNFSTESICSAHACSENGLKWFLFLFCLSAFDLGLFGEQILAVLKEGNS